MLMLKVPYRAFNAKASPTTCGMSARPCARLDGTADSFVTDFVRSKFHLVRKGTKVNNHFLVKTCSGCVSKELECTTRDAAKLARQCCSRSTALAAKHANITADVLN